MANPVDENEDNQRSTTAEALDDSAEVSEAASDSAAPDPTAELRREKDAIQDRLLRLAAEFDNYRKRVERVQRDQADAAVASAVEDLLPIIDNLERALEVSAGSGGESYRQGVELIYRQMLELLRRRGVTPLDSVGTDFDPQIHQAVAHEVSPGHREGEVMEELRRGYRLGDRLLRPAMVKVAKA
jgi:molecular chaperone GrpE